MILKFKKQVTFFDQNMISTNALPMFLLHHHLNGLRNKNLRSIQYVMRASDPAAEKFKRVCEDFLNVAILTKSATPGEIRLTFVHAAVGSKSLGESIVALSLTGDLSSTSVISLKIKIAFVANGDKIRLPIAEVLLRAADGNLTRYKKQRDWTPRNAVLIPPFLTGATILHGESDAGKLLKIFARSITESAKDEDITSKVNEANGDDSVVTIDAEEAKARPGNMKQAAAETLTTIEDDWDNILAFLHVVAIKYPRVIAAPLSFCADKCARVWFQR